MIERQAAPPRLTAGDLVLMPFADEHKLWRGDADRAGIETSSHRTPRTASGRSAMAAAVPRRGFVCGFLESAE